MAEEKKERAPLTEKQKMDRFWTIWNVAEASLLLIVGILAIVAGAAINDGSSDGWKNFASFVTQALAYAVGAFVILDGVLRLIVNFYHFNKESQESIMLVGGFEITLGIVVIILETQFEGVFEQALLYFIATALIVIGALFLTFSIMTIVKKYADKYFMPILEIIFGAILIGVGIFVFVLYKMNGTNSNRIVLILAGIVFVLVAIAQIVIALVQSHKAKKESKAVAKKEEASPAPEAKKDEKAEAKEQPEVIDVEAKEAPKAIEGKDDSDPKQIEQK